MKCRLQIVLFFFLISVSYTSSQVREVKISGIITDSTAGTPLVGTNILLYKDSLNLNTQPFRGSVTNEYGFYVITNLTEGSYYLIVKYIGYKTALREINIQMNDTTFRYDIKMSPEDIKLDEVIVQDKKINEE